MKDLARFSNENLQKYKWDEWITRLYVLRPTDFDFSIDWRLEAEKKMGKGMSEQEIRSFVHYFFESLSPSVYYDNLVNINPQYLAIEFIIDFQRKKTIHRKFGK